MFVRLRALLALALCTLLCLAHTPPAFGEALSFGALYVGQYDDGDAETFRSRMLAEGWHQEVWKTNNSTSTSMKPHHYHFTHGADDAMTEAGDDCDMLYVSGHGWRRAKIPIFWARTSSTPYDSLSADTLCVGGPTVHPWEIGVDWAGAYPSNESRWDSDIEWAIFAACNQLDYRTTSDRIAYPDGAPSNSSAKTWARTLLGAPSRMHAIFGYWDTAPAGSYDTAVTNAFLDGCFDDDLTLGTAWANANARYGFSWAFVTHTANRLDRFQGHGAGVTTDTDPDSSYGIDYYRAGVSGRILDGRGGSYESVSADREGDGAFAALKRVLGIESAFAAPVCEFESQGRWLNLDRMSETPRSAPTELQATPLVPHADRLLVSGAASQTTEGDSGTSRAFGRSVGAEGRESARVSARGEFEYHSGRGLAAASAGMSRERAVATARAYLLRVDPGFADAVAADVSEVTRTRLDLESDRPEASEAVQYQVRFVQRLDGMYVEGPGAGATVVLDSQGVNAAFGRWLDPGGEIRRGEDSKPVSARVALEQNAAEVGRAIKMPDGQVDLRNADAVWRLASGEDRLVPAWRFETAAGDAFYTSIDGDRLLE
jgi:hypothetical protein